MRFGIAMKCGRCSSRPYSARKIQSKAKDAYTSRDIVTADTIMAELACQKGRRRFDEKWIFKPEGGFRSFTTSAKSDAERDPVCSRATGITGESEEMQTHPVVGRRSSAALHGFNLRTHVRHHPTGDGRV